MLKGKYKEAEEALALWLEHLRLNCLLVTRRILQEKALQFSLLLKEENSEFTASVRSLNCSKKWFSICQKTISAKALSADKEVVQRLILFNKRKFLGSSCRTEMRQVSIKRYPLRKCLHQRKMPLLWIQENHGSSHHISL